jgi:hypothetical protein
MNFEIYGWMIVITLLILVALIVKVTWMLGVEHGYDLGFGVGYQSKQREVNQRNRQLVEDNDYLMGRVVQLFDQEAK